MQQTHCLPLRVVLTSLSTTTSKTTTTLSEVEISELPLAGKDSATGLGCSASYTAHWYFWSDEG